MRAIVSAQVVLGRQVGPAAILFDEGRIVSVVPPRDVGPDVDVTDYGRLVIMPGIVDCHVHINEPGRTEWEGFTTGTQAAAAGGVTTIVDMPLNCLPVTTNVEALQTKLDASEGQLHVDAGFWGGVIPGNADDLADLAEAGVLGCKAFMCDSGIPEFPASDERVLRAAMRRLRAAGIPLLAHAELESPVDVPELPPRSYDAWLRSRPTRWEDAAVAQLIELCRETKCATHVVHLSAATALPALAAARRERLPISAETCAHYLCLTAEDVPEGGTAFKCAPPIRDRSNRDRLWEALQSGAIDFVITDHSPCTPELKQLGSGDFREAWGGIASLQLGLPSVWTAAVERGASLADVSRWLSDGPARFAGLGDRKGRLAPGRDADFVVWDPDEVFEVSAEGLHQRHKISPYMGQSLRGAVKATWLRGVPVYEDGRFADPTGRAVLHRQGRV